MYNYAAVTVLRLHRMEFYRMNPGLFYDMLAIHNRGNQPKKEETE